jgi:hypothetical protein
VFCIENVSFVKINDDGFSIYPDVDVCLRSQSNLSPCLRSAFLQIMPDMSTYLHDTQTVQTPKPGRLFPKDPACQQPVVFVNTRSSYQHPVISLLNIHPINTLSSHLSPEYPACQHPVVSLLIIQPVNTLSSLLLNTQPVITLSSLS